MNNAENYAAVEVKRKSAKEEVMYELAERGEQQPQTQKRYFEKPDKPDDVIHSGKENGKETTAFGSLPPDDLRNIVILMVLCTSFLKRLHWTFGLIGRFIAGDSCWIGFWEYSIPVKSQDFLYPSWDI